MCDASGNVSGVPIFRQSASNFGGKGSEFAPYVRELINFAGVEEINWVSAMAGYISHCIGISDLKSSLGYLETGYGKEAVAAHERARHVLVASLERTREQEILLRPHSPGVVWKNLADVARPETHEARWAL